MIRTRKVYPPMTEREIIAYALGFLLSNLESLKEEPFDQAKYIDEGELRSLTNKWQAEEKPKPKKKRK